MGRWGAHAGAAARTHPRQAGHPHDPAADALACLAPAPHAAAPRPARCSGTGRSLLQAARAREQARGGEGAAHACVAGAAPRNRR